VIRAFFKRRRWCEACAARQQGDDWHRMIRDEIASWQPRLAPAKAIAPQSNHVVAQIRLECLKLAVSGSYLELAPSDDPTVNEFARAERYAAWVFGQPVSRPHLSMDEEVALGRAALEREFAPLREPSAKTPPSAGGALD
jgi:hypothetical protein